MQVDPDTYMQAAFEHSDLARELYLAGHFVYAIFAAGVAAECVFRANLPRREFDSRHDLIALLRESRVLERLPPARRETLSAAVADLWLRWRNTHRYFSAARLRKFIVSRRLHVRIKGDPVKENARIAVVAARTIVEQGPYLWNPS